jgi:hypothetical protein
MPPRSAPIRATRVAPHVLQPQSSASRATCSPFRSALTSVLATNLGGGDGGRLTSFADGLRYDRNEFGEDTEPRSKWAASSTTTKTHESIGKQGGARSHGSSNGKLGRVARSRTCSDPDLSVDRFLLPAGVRPSGSRCRVSYRAPGSKDAATLGSC